MEPLHILHLMLIAVWGGLALAEGALELGANDDAARAHAARLHRTLDLWLELPLLVGVVTTGATLAARAWPLSPMLWAKIGCGLFAVSVNLACVVAVFARSARVNDVDALRSWTRRIRFTGVGLPFFIAALWLGLAYFRA